MNEAAIQDFWQTHPCGTNLLDRRSFDEYDRFFREYDALKYTLEKHIPACLDDLRVSGEQVLEIGLGQGAESEQLIRRGAHWTGLDLTAEAVARVRTRLEARQLPFDDVVQGSVLKMPFPDGKFDLVFSHGVLHHVPDIVRAQSEIARVLKPGGRLVIMLYAKNSLNYRVGIAIVRRLGLIALYLAHVRPKGVAAAHLENARKTGLFNYLKLQNFIHANTDGPLNPYSKVYDVGVVRADFPDFRVEKIFKRFMHAPPLPVHGLPFESLAGWHLWVHLRKVS